MFRAENKTLEGTRMQGLQRTCSTQVAVWHVASSAADNAFEFPVINACTMPRQFVALSEANPALALVEKALQSLCDIMWIGREH